MNITLLLITEFLLFNVTIILLYQPKFILSLVSLEDKTTLSKKMYYLGLVFLCMLFLCSFLLGANFVIYKNSFLVL